ncbi:Protein LURP-one-related 15 [Acorus gramineus]|uniref:Protein LURP-one-related 15 n=1 Tax=Acorus gramineus TaxID=55184 RepID=A0AAV9B1L6_ACOGR|nr:Protein LURP-one-related 15 [Acorus gramineus]
MEGPPPAVVSAYVPVLGPQFCFPNHADLTVTKTPITLSGGDFVVTDSNGGVVFKVQGRAMRVRDRRVLVDAVGNPILTMKEKIISLSPPLRGHLFPSLFCQRGTHPKLFLLHCFSSGISSLHRLEASQLMALKSFQQEKGLGLRTLHKRWQVYRGDSTESKELLFSVKRSSFLQVQTELHVFMAQHSREDVCDFKVFGNYSDRMCTVSLANSSAAIAQMSRKYTVTNLLLRKDTFKVTVLPNVDCAFITALIVILDEITDHK